jgi:hypothetical protein
MEKAKVRGHEWAPFSMAEMITCDLKINLEGDFK